MPKRVLGNDPFLRGAADRSTHAGESTAKPAPSPAPTKAKRADRVRAPKAPAAKKSRAKRAPPTPPEPVAAAALEPLETPTERIEPVLLATPVEDSALARVEVQPAAVQPAPLAPVPMARALWSALRATIGLSSAAQLDDFGKDDRLQGATEPLLEFLYRTWWRVEVQGAEWVPEGPCVLVANHSGTLPFDGPILQRALRTERPGLAEPRWLVEDQIFYTPGLGTLMNRLGAVRACPENALALLAENRPVIVFPEGTHGAGKQYSERYQLKRLGRGGFAKLAIRTRAPLVPVAIVGAEEAMPLWAKLPGRFLGLPYLPITPVPLPTKWIIRFGEPLPVDRLAEADADAPEPVQRLVDGTRQAIEGMLQALLKERRSVFQR